MRHGCTSLFQIAWGLRNRPGIMPGCSGCCGEAGREARAKKEGGHGSPVLLRNNRFVTHSGPDGSGQDVPDECIPPKTPFLAKSGIRATPFQNLPRLFESACLFAQPGDGAALRRRGRMSSMGLKVPGSNIRRCCAAGRGEGSPMHDTCFFQYTPRCPGKAGKVGKPVRCTGVFRNPDGDSRIGQPG